jgi:hypothetical protein
LDENQPFKDCIMYVKLFAVLPAIVLSGCITVTETNVSTLSIGDLCTSRIVAKNLGQPDKARLAFSEIQKRGGFTAAELQAIEGNQVFVGMSEAAGLCAWGTAFDTINTTATAGGVRRQYVYLGNEYVKTRYLYSAGGRITGFQT